MEKNRKDAKKSGTLLIAMSLLSVVVSSARLWTSMKMV